MATALMRWLERRPHSYERGVQWLTLGRLRRLHARLVDRYIRPGMRVLELGCGGGEGPLCGGRALHRLRSLRLAMPAEGH